MVYTPTQRIVFKDEVLKIEINTALPLLQLTWQQHPTSEQYRRGYRQAMYLALEYRIKWWLTDARQVTYLPLADQHWMYAKMRPWLKGGKLLKFAIVIQAETWLMTDLKPVYNYLESTAEPRKEFNLEFFLDLEAARFWLLAENQKFED
jgi:hypothetical protein